MPRSEPPYPERAREFLERMAGLRGAAQGRIAWRHAVRNAISARKGGKRKGKGKDEGGELAPVEPDKPRPLSGGAAAALEFDD